MLRGNLFNLRINDTWQRDWWLLLFIKLLVAVFLPFFSDEAYYWTWSHNLKLSYFDHPPFVSWLFWMGIPFENFHFAARLPAVLLGHLTIWIWCAWIGEALAAEDKRKLFWILSVHILIGFGGLIANPDIPYLFFWSLSLFFYLQSLKRIDSLLWPSLLGVSLGLGFTSKYLIALFAPLMIAHLIVTNTWHKLRWHHLALPFFIGALFSSPVWLWNYQHDWQSFRFQLAHGLGKKYRPQFTTDFLLGTLILLFPPFVSLFLKKSLFKDYKNLHVLTFVGLFIFFVYTTFGGDTELNWPLVLYPSFFICLVPYLQKSRLYLSFLSFFGLLGVFILGYLFISPNQGPQGRLREAAIYKKLHADVQNFTPLYTSTYQTASYFWFLDKKPTYKLRFSSRPDEYDSMAESQPQEDLFYFLKEEYQTIPEEQSRLFTFEKILPLEYQFEIYKAVRKK